VTAGLHTLLEGPTTLDPHRCALIVGDDEVSYARLDDVARRVAGGLIGAGTQPGWRIPVADDASLLSVATVLGAPHAGAAAALMNPRLTAGELADLVEVAATATLGVAGPVYETRLAEALGGPVLGSALLDAPPVPARSSPPGADDEAVVLFTSGTTGRPKAVPITHGQLTPRIAAFAPVFDPGVAPSISIMSVPLVHIGGMLGLFVSLARANTTVVLTRFDAADWLALVERHRVNTAFLVPTMLHRILEHPRLARTDLSSLKEITYGAAPASPELIGAAMSALPWVSFSNVFGQTETLGSITALGPADHAAGKLTSVGRPLPGVEVRVSDPSSGAELAVGEVGELWVKTVANVSAGPGLTDEWLKTGDMVSVDADGYLYAAGRLSDTINRGGEKFAPSEIADVLATHPAVGDVAVAGYPDPEMGQRVGALVVATTTVSEAELRDHCRGRLAAFKLPERVVFVDEIPYNDFGKVARKTLGELLADPPGR